MKDISVVEVQQLREELQIAKKELAAYRELEMQNFQLREKLMFRSVFDNSRLPILILDMELKIISANKAFYSNFMTGEADITGKRLYDVDGQQWNTGELQAALLALIHEDALVTNLESILESGDGRSLSFKAGIQKVEEEKYIFLEVEDFTDRIKEKAETKEKIHRYRELIYSSPSHIAILTGEDFIVEVANDAILESWGKGRDVIGKPLFKEVLPEMLFQGMEKLFKRVCETEKAFRTQEMPLYFERSGKMRRGYYDFVLQPHRNISGKIAGVVVIATDTTTQAKLHQQIKEDERKFRQMADLVPDKIATADSRLNSYYFNKNWLDYSGMSLEQLKGQGWRVMVHPEDMEKADRKLTVAYEEQKEFEMEIRYRNFNGDYKWHLVRASQVRDEKVNSKLWIFASTEIHKIKEEEKRKEDFLKMASHELKTPVTSIKGYVQLLIKMLGSKTDAPVNSLPLNSSLLRIDSQVSRLTRLISEMLDISRMEEGRLEIKKELFSINDLVETSVQDISFSQTESQIMVYQKDNYQIYGDKDRIGQVIINFITNAIKYSPENSAIEVRVYRDEAGMGCVSVKDFGIGIKEKDQENIFQRFYRVSGRDEDTYSGFGIGLYLAKEIIDRHRGSIKVNSAPGKGSEFIFSLPVAEE